jgi:hypothetical protein
MIYYDNLPGKICESALWNNYYWLRSYYYCISRGMDQDQIDTLKRWDRVHVIRDILASRVAADP